MRLIGLIAFLLNFTIGNSQKAFSNWLFGDSAGIKFENNAVVTLSGSMMSTSEGVATVSDSIGVLLFYTDGVKVYNRKHKLINKGFDLKGNTSSAHSAIIVKRPGFYHSYYIFTVTGPNHGVFDYGAHYSEIDM